MNNEEENKRKKDLTKILEKTKFKPNKKAKLVEYLLLIEKHLNKK